MHASKSGDEAGDTDHTNDPDIAGKGSLDIVIGKKKSKIPLNGVELDQRARSLRGKPGDEREREELERQRDLLVAATESALDAVMVTDPEGQIQYVNPAFERLTGYTRNEVLGESLDESTEINNGKEVVAQIHEALANDQAWSGRLTSVRKDGTPFIEECSVAAVRDQEGRALGTVHIRRDISERLRLEAAAAEVTTMNNLGAVFSGIRHEIGNPINSTKSILSLLRSNLDRYPPEKIQDYLDRALQKMTQVEYLLGTLKSFNMFESPRFQEVELKPFLELLANLISKDLMEQGIRVTTRIEPGAERCRADPRALQQVMLNLLANAADALRDRLEPAIAMRVERAGPDIRILVQDNGRGMTDEQQVSLFRPFQTSKPGGTGLGLVLARKLLATMDGTLEIYSLAGEGTTATITIGGVREDSH